MNVSESFDHSWLMCTSVLPCSAECCVCTCLPRFFIFCMCHAAVAHASDPACVHVTMSVPWCSFLCRACACFCCAHACLWMIRSLHDARNSRGAGGFLPVCKSTSYNLEVGRQGPTGTRRCTKGWGFSVWPKICVLSQRWEAGGKFSAGRRCTGGRLRVHFPGGNQAHGTSRVKGGCGHTFPPPGGSWYPIRVTWIRIGHQAINGLDECVWNHTDRGFGC